MAFGEDSSYMTIGIHGEDWRWLQEEVARLLNQIPGCVARVNQSISGARGTVQVDVWTEFGYSVDSGGKEESFHGKIGHRFVFKVVVECKAWKRRISQDRLHTLKSTVDDVGADRGILISNFGVQRGAQVLLNSPINLYAFTLDEFRSEIGKLGSPGVWQGARHAPGSVTMKTSLTSCPESLVAGVGFDLLGEDFGGNVERAMNTALKAGAVFPDGGDALVIFQNTLAASIRDIEGDKRGQLFQRFLRDGPYECEGPIPPG